MHECSLNYIIAFGAFVDCYYKMAAKSVIVIAGYAEDPQFVGLCYIADTLVTALPNFQFRSIVKTSSEWQTWLKQVCTVYDWFHLKSPLVWREIGISGRTINYIGGPYQFWDLLHRYYNIELHFTKEELQHLKCEFQYALKIHPNTDLFETKRECRLITIIGAGRSLCPDLVPQLVTIQELWKSHGVLIKLYDEPGHYFKLKKIVKDSEATGGGLRSVIIVESIKEGLYNCDILIYLDTLLREEGEEMEDWLKRNYDAMAQLSEQINSSAPAYMKVILSSMGLSCFCTNILHLLITKLPKTSIVSTSAQYGLEILHPFVSSLGFEPRGFGYPPVWGYLGINQYVDICHIVQKHDSYRVTNRISKSSKNSSLPIGTRRPELRWFAYAAYNKNPYDLAIQRKAIAQYQIGRSEDFQKCRAICDLLKLWYAPEIGDEIISLAIDSNGTFGIPKGLTFSQPVHLKVLANDRRVWVPCAEFPMPDIPIWMFKSLIDTAMILREKFALQSHIQHLL